MNENLKAERESALLFVNIGEEMFKNNSYIEAINYCNMALGQFPDLKEAKILLYKIYRKKKDERKSKEIIDYLIKEFPDDNEVKELMNNEKKDEPIVDSVKEIKEEEPKENKQEEHIEENTFLSADETENLLDKALSEINEIKGVLGSIIIEEYGIIIKEKTVKGLDAEIAAALFSTIFSVSEDAVSKIDMGSMERIFIEIGKVRIYLFKGSGYILGIFTEEIVKIGLIHVKAKQLLRNIKKVLGG